MTTYTRQLCPNLSKVDSYIKSIDSQVKDKEGKPATVTYIDTVFSTKSDYVTGEQSYGIKIDSFLDMAHLTFLLSTVPTETHYTPIPLVKINGKYDNFCWAMSNSDYTPTHFPTNTQIQFFLEDDWIWCYITDEDFPYDYYDVTVVLWNNTAYGETILTGNKQYIGTEGIGKLQAGMLNTAIDSPTDRQIDSDRRLIRRGYLPVPSIVTAYNNGYRGCSVVDSYYAYEVPIYTTKGDRL